MPSTIPIDPNFKGSDNPEQPGVVPSPAGNDTEIVRDNKSVEPATPETESELERLKMENERLQKEIEMTHMELNKFKTSQPQTPETPEPTEDIPLEDLIYADPDKYTKILKEKTKKEILSELGVTEQELKETVETVKMQKQILQQQTIAAEKIKALNLDPKVELNTYGSAIMEKLKNDPSLAASPNGVYLAYLAVKYEKNEFQPTNVRQKATVHGGNVAPGAGEVVTLSPDEERAYQIFLADLKDEKGKPAISRAEFKRQIEETRKIKGGLL